MASTNPIPSNSNAALLDIQRKVWKGSIPLEIRLSPVESRRYDQSDPYIVSILSFIGGILYTAPLFIYRDPCLI